MTYSLTHYIKSTFAAAVLSGIALSAQAAPPRGDIPQLETLPSDTVELRPYASAYVQASCELVYGGQLDGRAYIRVYQIQEYPNLHGSGLIPVAVLKSQETLNLATTAVDSRWNVMKTYCDILIRRQCHTYNYNTERWINDTFAALRRSEGTSSWQVEAIATKCR